MRHRVAPFPLICCGLLLLALAPMPYGYYIFLRIVICIWGIIIGIQEFGTSRGNMTSLLAYGIAILYNPVIRIHFTRDIWQVVNIVTILVILAIALKSPEKD